MPTPLSRSAARLSLLSSLVLPLVLAAGAASVGAAEPVGGPRLGSAGIVVGAGSPTLPATVAAGWLVADLDTGDVLGGKNPHGRFAPASTLKALTALTLIPRLDVHREVTPTYDDVNADGSRVGLVESVPYPVSQLFTAMLVVSGNDAANTLATANGGVPATVAQMNARARQLQAYDTFAATPNGLDAPGQRSSPYDLALIARAAMDLPDFRHYVATKHSRIRGLHGKTIAISSHDKLLYNYPGAIGIKNGFTVAARATFIGAATRNGHTLVVTLMHTAPRYWPEAAALLDWGFAAEKAGATPVGTLVGPQGTAGPAVAAVGDVRAASALPAAGRRRDRFPVLPVALLTSGLGAAGYLVRRRFT